MTEREQPPIWTAEGCRLRLPRSAGLDDLHQLDRDQDARQVTAKRDISRRERPCRSADAEAGQVVASGRPRRQENPLASEPLTAPVRTLRPDKRKYPPIS